MINPNNMQITAYELIKRKIILAEYIPGQKISENMIVSDINLGRTPVREALIHLKKDNLIDVIPQSGSYVAKIDLISAKNARFVREKIEKQIIKEATQDNNKFIIPELERIINLQRYYYKQRDTQGFFLMDDEFHKAFYLATNKGQVWEWLQILNSQLTRFRWLRLKLTSLKWQKLIEQHLAIFESVKANDTPLATKLVAYHLHLMLEEQQTLVDTFPDYFINND